MRPMPVKSEDAKDAPATMQQQQQQPSSTTGSSGGSSFSLTRRVGARGGPQLFAHKLFTLVEEEDSEIVEWLPDGLAFRVKDIHRFSCEVLEKYFNHSKFTSFQRQLNLYQFKRRKGAHAGAFHHPSFRRGQRHLLSKVRRQKVKRDLAVEARAAQRHERTKSDDAGDGSFSSQSPQEHRLSGRGRTRAAVQDDLRPIRRRRKIKGDNDNDNDDDDEDDDDEYVTGDDDDDDEEFDAAAVPGSRRSALGPRLDAGPTGGGGGGIGARYHAQDVTGDESSSNDDTWPTENSPGGGGGGGGGGGLEQLSSGDDDEQRLDWGGVYGNNNNWRQQAPGSPERSPSHHYLHHVSTPMIMTSPSEYEDCSSGGDVSGLDRTSSVGSSIASTVSFASSPCHSETMFHSSSSSSSPYQFNDYCDESGQNESAKKNNNQHSPMSVHSAVGQAVASVQAAAVAAVTQASPAQQQQQQQRQQQQQQQDIDLSFAAVVDASISGWNSPQQLSSSSLPHLEEPFGWGPASIAAGIAAAGDAAGAAPWSDQPSSSSYSSSSSSSSSSGVPLLHHHHHSSQPSSPQEDFGFIDLFAANWDTTSEGVAQLPPSPMDSSVGVLSFSSSSSSGGGGGENISLNDAFLKQAQAAGVFGGVEEFLIPQSSSSSSGGVGVGVGGVGGGGGGGAAGGYGGELA